MHSSFSFFFHLSQLRSDVNSCGRNTKPIFQAEIRILFTLLYNSCDIAIAQLLQIHIAIHTNAY